MRRLGYLLAMLVVVPVVALGAAVFAFIVSINTGIDCAREWK